MLGSLKVCYADGQSLLAKNSRSAIGLNLHLMPNPFRWLCHVLANTVNSFGEPKIVID